MNPLYYDLFVQGQLPDSIVPFAAILLILVGFYGVVWLFNKVYSYFYKKFFGDE
mgnify:CR=1 FL=1